MKKAISLGVAAAMAATLLAGCGTAASSAAASSEAASTADSTTAESTATSEAAPSEAHEINTTDPIELTIFLPTKPYTMNNLWNYIFIHFSILKNRQVKLLNPFPTANIMSEKITPKIKVIITA